jgi:hypothetical protein
MIPYKEKHEIWLVPYGPMFIQNFMQIGQLVHKLNRGNL